MQQTPLFVSHVSRKHNSNLPNESKAGPDQYRRAAANFKPPRALPWQMLDKDEQALATRVFKEQRVANHLVQTRATNTGESIHYNKWWYTAPEARGVNQMSQAMRCTVAEALARARVTKRTITDTSDEGRLQLLEEYWFRN